MVFLHPIDPMMVFPYPMDSMIVFPYPMDPMMVFPYPMDPMMAFPYPMDPSLAGQTLFFSFLFIGGVVRRTKNNSLVKLAWQVRVALSKNFLDRK